MAEVIEAQFEANLPAGAVVLATGEEEKVVEIETEAVLQPDVMQIAADPPEQEMEAKGDNDLHIALSI